ncbi:protein of unknown function DUF1996 [Fusarium oxysporum f. sp. vasinfectum]|nr:protein of unknown function DUF1996 [Fusarium oxysporum f. sp. vasinfectum]
MKLHVLAAVAAALAGLSSAATDKRKFAVLRFTNKQLTKGRMDPIVFPGEVASHVHTVLGGSGFSLKATGEDLKRSECSNALVKGDNSNYWFPSLYFQDPKTGDLESVDLYYFNAYYFFDKTHDDIKAFPLGLQILAGDAMTRTVPETGGKPNIDPSRGSINAARYTCPRSKYDPPSWMPNSDGSEAGIGDPVNLGEGVGFPDRTCDALYSPLRADVHFPSCYNPKAGLTDFKNNMAYPEDNNGYLDCPEGWVHVPHLFFESYWDTQKFQGHWEEGKGKQPFVLSNGDTTGYSNHADFLAGWDEELLQHIIDTCDAGTSGMDKCPGLFYGLNSDPCTIDSEVDETVDGIMKKLPGNNPLIGWLHGFSAAMDAVNSTGPNQNNAQASSKVPVIPTKTATTRRVRATGHHNHPHYRFHRHS